MALDLVEPWAVLESLVPLLKPFAVMVAYLTKLARCTDVVYAYMCICVPLCTGVCMYLYVCVCTNIMSICSVSLDDLVVYGVDSVVC